LRIAPCIPFARPKAHNEYRYLARRRLRLEDLAYRKAVQIGQQQIQQDDIRQMQAGQVQRFNSVASHQRLAALQFEVVRDQCGKFRLIIDDQYLWFHAGNLTFACGAHKTSA
jgi:hypothetical protein